MSTIKSSNEDITINADGSGRSVKFQANGVEKASIDSSGNFTSTSIDATKLSGALPAIDGSALTNLPGGGKVLQVVTGVSNSTTTNSTTTYTQATGMSLSITPTSTSSKILVLMSFNTHENTGDVLTVASIFRGSTNLAAEPFDGMSICYHAATDSISQIGLSHLDSPSTTSTITYNLMFKQHTWASGYCQIGFNIGGASTGADNTITLMEIGV